MNVVGMFYIAENIALAAFHVADYDQFEL